MTATSTPPRMMLDIDDTIYGFSDVCGRDREALVEYSLDGVSVELHEWAISPAVMIEQGFYPGACEAISSLRSSGVEVIVCTRRPEANVRNLGPVLEKMGLEFDQIHGGPMFDKVALCRELGCTVIVDDMPKTIIKALDAGLEVASLDFPYVRPLVDRGLVICPDWEVLAEHLASLLLTRVPSS